ncbi:MAG: DUF4292 domain-containing protein [bacterium]
MMFPLTRRTAVLILCCAYLCIVWGCAGKYRQPGGTLLPVEKSLHQLLERRSAFQDFRGRASVSITREGKKQSFSANLVFDASHRTRIEGLGFADTPYFFLVADSNRICFYAPDQQRVLCGESSGRNLYRLTGICLQPESLVELFSGNLPADVSLKTLKRGSLSGEGENIEFFSRQNQAWYRIQVDRERGVMVRMETLDADREPLFTVLFDDYQTVEGYTWPRRIECSFIPSKVHLKIRYKQFSLNSGITDSAYRLPYPSGTVIENIGRWQPER